MVSIGGDPSLFTQGKSTGESALLYDYFWGVGLKTPWSVVSYVFSDLETGETGSWFTANAPPDFPISPVNPCDLPGFFMPVQLACLQGVRAEIST